MNKHTYPMGSVSSGTMRPQDLFESFMWELNRLDHARWQSFKSDYPDMGESDDRLDEAVEALFDILGEFAGPYFYFGAHPGDGADYGFWFCEDSFEDAVSDGEILKVSDLSKVKSPSIPFKDGVYYFAVVSDHGNVTLCDLNGEEVWATV
jgi:hypothetical protein